MSIHVMTKVWKLAPYAGGELNLLLALADWADDDGRCFPSVPVIAEKSRMTERQVYRVIAEFKRVGILTVEPGGGRGKRNVYVINTDKMSGFKKLKKDDTRVRVSKPETLTSTPRNPDTHVNSPRPPNRCIRQEPSVNTNTPHSPQRGQRGQVCKGGQVKSVPKRFRRRRARDGPSDAQFVHEGPGIPEDEVRRLQEKFMRQEKQHAGVKTG